MICPDNTVHQGLDLVREQAPLPWLHIAEEVAVTAVARGFRKVLLLGTRYLTEGPVYPSKLDAAGIGHMLPPASARVRINDLIFDELVNGRFDSATRSYFAQVIAGHKEMGCDAVVLGCTEIPLLITEQD